MIHTASSLYLERNDCVARNGFPFPLFFSFFLLTMMHGIKAFSVYSAVKIWNGYITPVCY